MVGERREKRHFDCVLMHVSYCTVRTWLIKLTSSITFLTAVIYPSRPLLANRHTHTEELTYTRSSWTAGYDSCIELFNTALRHFVLNNTRVTPQYTKYSASDCTKYEIRNVRQHYTLQHNTTLQYSTLHLTLLHCTTLHHTPLHYTTLPYPTQSKEREFPYLLQACRWLV